MQKKIDKTIAGTFLGAPVGLCVGAIIDVSTSGGSANMPAIMIGSGVMGIIAGGIAGSLYSFFSEEKKINDEDSVLLTADGGSWLNGAV